MLYLYTSKDKINERVTFVDDVEAFFSLHYDKVLKNYEKSRLALFALKQIEGMTSHNGSELIAKFGAVALQDISTGGKSALLIALYGSNIAVSLAELGYNVLDVLAMFAENVDVTIYSDVMLTSFPDVLAYVNDVLCDGSDAVLNKLEEYYV